MIQARAQNAPWRRTTQFLLAGPAPHPGTRLVASVTWEQVEHGMASEPTFELDLEAAQTLMDDLWQCGYRPTEGSGSAGSLAATQRHLEDMRTLVFKKGAA